jgi:hypothetical protein
MRWARRLFWAWQGLFVLWGALLLAGLVLDETRPGSGDGLLFTIGLLPVLLPAWLPVTAVLGLLWWLSTRKQR